jgi:hypothetical protein
MLSHACPMLWGMPLPPPTLPGPREDRRIAADRARDRRALRVGQLRNQVIAASVATFALAFGLVAFDGSMGSQTASSSASPGSGAAVTGSAQPPATDDFGTLDDGGSGQPAPGPDQGPAPVTSSQS